jgi:hypothetical protein
MTATEESPSDAASPALAAFRSGAAEARERDLLAFALAVEGGDRATAEAIARRRHEADALLAAWALRFLHNRIEEIRLGAVRERLGALPRPPGFARLVLAAFLGVVLGGAALGWLAGQEALIEGAVARLRDLADTVTRG